MESEGCEVLLNLRRQLLELSLQIRPCFLVGADL